ncbi:Putative peptidoglycan binding domain-containing protein [Modestobacter sp. DSM 44400]|uniref:VanW family protein n=1 Tax=Modestobacter sp. DSM 44400 TaxID=1550230 RepID=UPI00089AB0D3|nr:VanW family protein [Modestobacter sp. DSM 44400]SDY14384.1 Putative peptidoglycan binding domain-containing protein [Modestobacter sp. DSM 44400]
MPQDSSTEPDTRRLLPDGSVRCGRPAPPRPSGGTPPPAGDTPPPAGAVDPAAPDERPTVAVPPRAVAADDEPGPAEVTAALPTTAAAPSPPALGPRLGDTPPPPPVDPADPGNPEDSSRPAAGRPWWRRRAVLAPAAVVVALAALYGIDLLAAGDDVPRHTVVAGVEIGGLSPAAAGDLLTEELVPRVSADHTLVADGVPGVLHPPAAGIALDAPGTVDAADDQPLNPWTRLTTLASDREVDPVFTADETAMAAQLEQFAGTVDRAAVDATITIDGTTPSVVAPVDGRTVDRDGAAAAITAALSGGGDPATPIELPVDVVRVRVLADEAQRVFDETVTPALSAPVTVLAAEGGDSVELPVSAIAASLTFTPDDDGTLTVAVDPAALQTSMDEEFGVFGTPAEDARFEVSGGAISVIPSVDGQGINPTQLADQLLGVLDDPAPRSVTATLGPVPAEFTTEQAQALGITEEVSSFSTNFTSPASGTNIRVVAAEVDGALVRPGETFSLNDFTGPRGTAQGYVPAAVISGGKLSQAVGGGISQFATTMFNAVFFAGLEDVHHKPHSFYISRYPAGREATVYEGQIDLQWKNDTDTGIYVQTEWVPGTLTVRFWGTEHYDVESVSSERRNAREPAVQEKVDDGNCTPQSGSTGFDITVTRVFKDLGTGAELRREDFNTRYAAEAVIRCVPPTVPAPAPPAGAAPSAPVAPAG